MNKYTIYFKQLPRPIQLSTYVYFGSLLLYNGIGAWYDAKNKLIQYRENKLNEYEKNEIKDEWSAVKYGSNSNFSERFFNSIIWPVKTITNLIPFMVLQLNPPPTETKTNIETSSSEKHE
jgi:hypothetical protein